MSPPSAFHPVVSGFAELCLNPLEMTLSLCNCSFEGVKIVDVNPVQFIDTLISLL